MWLSLLDKLIIQQFEQFSNLFFSDKINCNICDQILEGLELIDDECDVYGIHMVKIQDPQLAKRYSIKTFPAMVYFRNGNPLLFEGDLQNEQSVLEWLIDDDNRELADEIEEVNDRMLERLLAESSLMVVFFCEFDSENLLQFLENTLMYFRWWRLPRMWGNSWRIGGDWWRSWSVWHWFCKDRECRSCQAIWNRQHTFTRLLQVSFWEETSSNWKKLIKWLIYFKPPFQKTSSCFVWRGFTPTRESHHLVNFPGCFRNQKWNWRSKPKDAG